LTLQIRTDIEPDLSDRERRLRHSISTPSRARNPERHDHSGASRGGFRSFQGVAAAAAAGVLLTVTGTLGGLLFAAWAGLDLAAGDRRVRAAAARLLSGLPWRPARHHVAWSRLAALPAHRRRSIEHAYFGGLSQLQIARVLGPTAA
jgi:hypothetical protein